MYTSEKYTGIRGNMSVSVVLKMLSRNLKGVFQSTGLREYTRKTTCSAMMKDGSVTSVRNTGAGSINPFIAITGLEPFRTE